MTDAIGAILAQRGSTHGDFTVNARVAQGLLRAMTAEEGWRRLSDVQAEALWMFCHKMARIVGGNPDHRDHWDDIAGYARLASERCRRPTAAELEAILRAPEPDVVVQADGSTVATDFFALVASYWSVPYAEARARMIRVAFGSAATSRTGEECLAQLQYKWRETREGALRTLRELSWKDEDPRARGPQDTHVVPPVTDSSRHAQVLDGMIGSYYAEMGLPSVSVRGSELCLLDRRAVPPAEWEHLPRLTLEKNHSEWKELPSEHRGLYAWNEVTGKYEMGEEFWECWGRE